MQRCPVFLYQRKPLLTSTPLQKIDRNVNIALSYDILFLLHPEPAESGFRLASIQLKDVVGSSSINPEDWPSYQVPGDVEIRSAYSHTILPFAVSEEDPTLELIASRIAARASSWSRSPSTRVTVILGDKELDELCEYKNIRNSAFDVEFGPGDDGRGDFTVLHEHHYACGVVLYNNPSFSIRSLVGEDEEWLPQTFAVAFDGNGDCYHRRNDLEFFPADTNEDDISAISIDYLGRMVVYKLSSESRTKYIGIIRFD